MPSLLHLLLQLLLMMMPPFRAAPCLLALLVTWRTRRLPHRWMLPGAAVQWQLPPHQQQPAWLQMQP
jgi:hypothetical protein